MSTTPRAGIRTKDLGTADETPYAPADNSVKVESMDPQSGPQAHGDSHGDEEIPLRDGTYALIRPIAADDGPVLVEFHRQLSGRAHFPRYFSGDPVLSSGEIQFLTCVDGWNRVTLVVETNGALIALALRPAS